MHFWFDSPRAASLGISAHDIVAAVQDQYLQVSSCQIGAPPMPNGADLMISINAQGRLQSVEEFGEIVLKTGDQGQVARLRDVARIELASSRSEERRVGKECRSRGRRQREKKKGWNSESGG